MDDIRDYLDASELTEEEFDQIDQALEDSLAYDYLQEMARLKSLGKYTEDLEGWQMLVDEAWATAVRNNPVCGAITSKSEERRQNRAKASQAVPEAPATPWAAVAPMPLVAQMLQH